MHFFNFFFIVHFSKKTATLVKKKQTVLQSKLKGTFVCTLEVKANFSKL